MGLWRLLLALARWVATLGWWRGHSWAVHSMISRRPGSEGMIFFPLTQRPIELSIYPDHETRISKRVPAGTAGGWRVWWDGRERLSPIGRGRARAIGALGGGDGEVYAQKQVSREGWSARHIRSRPTGSSR